MNKMIKFKFKLFECSIEAGIDMDYIYNHDDYTKVVWQRNEVNHSSPRAECGKGDFYEINEYERYKYIKCFYNIFNLWLKNYKPNTITVPDALMNYMYNIINCLVSINANSIFETEIPGINKYTIQNLEKKLSHITFSEAECSGAVANLKLKLLNSDFKHICNNYLLELNSIIKSYLDSKNEYLLSKMYYSQNIDALFDTLNIKNKKIKDVFEFICFSRIYDLKRIFKPDLALNTILFRLGYKEITNKDIIKYIKILFIHEGDKILNIPYGVCNAILHEYSSPMDCIQYVFPKITTSPLDKDNFKHIKEYSYILNILKDAIQNKKKGVNILLYGPQGTGKSELARSLITQANCNGYEVLSTNTPEDACISTAGRREMYNMLSNLVSRLSKDAIIVFDEAEDLFKTRDKGDLSKMSVNIMLEKNETPVIYTANELFWADQSFLRRFTYALCIDNLPIDIFKVKAQQFADEYNIKLKDNTLDVIAQYRPNMGTLKKSISNYALSHTADQSFLISDIEESIRCQCWGCDVLPKVKTNNHIFNPKLMNTSVDLNEIVNNIKQTNRLDFSMLLYGVSGGSKTSFARYLAKQLNLYTIHKTYAELASPYVGETEHHIHELFKQAKKEKALIILDEADVLLRDRTKAQRSYEVSVTEAMLTCMEDHPYPFIMTTNLYQDIDTAVMRRVLYKVRHEYLTENQIKLAFNHFFGFTPKNKLHLSRLTAGDFALVKKQAEFQNKLTDEKWLISQLTEEMNLKKDNLNLQINV